MVLDEKWSIVQTKDGCFRYVNHERRLLTTGFGTQAGLEKNADIISTRPSALKLMAERYEGEIAIRCPTCNEIVRDVAFASKLNKCWNCGLAFDSEEPETE